MPLIDLLQKQDDGDFLRAVAEAVSVKERKLAAAASIFSRGNA